MKKRHKKFSSIGKDLTQDVISGSIYRTNRKIDKIGVHCSASPQGRGDDAYEIDRWHQEHPSWGGIGYHFVVLEDGTVQKGRWLDNMPIHAKGYNTGAIAICRIGGIDKDGKTLYDATPEQKKMITILCELLIETYGLTVDDVKGHKEFPGVTKACPVMNMNEIREMISERIANKSIAVKEDISYEKDSVELDYDSIEPTKEKKEKEEGLFNTIIKFILGIFGK